MGSCDDAKALAEGQRAARSAIPEWDRVTPQANPKDSPARRRSPGGADLRDLFLHGEDRAVVAGKIGERSERRALNRSRIG
jgi:hypothetical protein